MIYPRLVIAGVQSGVGKTTVSLGLMKALSNRGLRVQPFKVGPDYIDTGLHYQACGHISHNLDNWMGDDKVVQTVFAKHAADCDIAIIEGVMGLYDGVKTARLKGSTASMAMLLKAPVILVVNVEGMAQSCVALVKGFMDYEPRLNLAAVVLNKTGKYHRTILKEHLEEDLNIKVIGCLPRHREIYMPARHLGLLPAEENHELQSTINKMADLIEENVDVEAVMQLASQAGKVPAFGSYGWPIETPAGRGIRIGVARDAAFTFYYQDGLDYLQELGAQIIYFSPLNDDNIPETDGIYLGGGFPEVFLSQLAKQTSMLSSIRAAHKKGLPIYAECGGFIYLCKNISDFKGCRWPGVGIIPAEAQMGKNLAGLGYVEAKMVKDSILGSQGDIYRGHEFRYSQVTGLNPADAAYSLSGGKGEEGRRDGYAQGNLLASYAHLHFRSNPAAARKFLESCYRFKEKGSHDNEQTD